MTRAFGDDELERQLRAILHERAEEVAARARTAAEITTELAPLLMRGSRAARELALLRVGGFVLIILMLGALMLLFGGRQARPPVELLVAVQLPLAGEPAAPPLADAVRLALADPQGTSEVTLALPADGVLDDSVDGAPDVDRAARNTARIAADPRYVAIVGPFHSFLAESTIPVANAAGLLQCSPTNTARADGRSRSRVAAAATRSAKLRPPGHDG